MSIGYASRVIGSEQMSMKSCTLKNATHDRLVTLIGHNLSSLETILDYNQNNGIELFRISSDIIPFGSSIASSIPWQEQFMQQLASIGEKAKQSNIRVSMHPGQYTVLNSPDSSVVKRSIEDLVYHADFLDSLGVDSTHKIVLHIGGVYGDKKASLSRFVRNYLDLDFSIRQRLVIENDDKSYHIGDVLELSAQLGIPAVYDTLHNQINTCDATKNDTYWISQCQATWKTRDGRQKIHYSQQDKSKKSGSHSETIAINDFLDFYTTLDDHKPDIMLEVKDKNLSAIKCICCTSSQKSIRVLEEEWSRYKYLVLEKAPNDYKAIRTLLKEKGSYPALAFYQYIEHALSQEAVLGMNINAALHVWGYFKDIASLREKEQFQKKLQQCKHGDCPIGALKRYLYRLSQTYQKHYLLQSYYFYL